MWTTTRKDLHSASFGIFQNQCKRQEKTLTPDEKQMVKAFTELIGKFNMLEIMKKCVAKISQREWKGSKTVNDILGVRHLNLFTNRETEHRNSLYVWVGFEKS